MRSIEKVERILAAARELICQVSFEQFTTDLISQKAGMSVGSIYQYFSNKIEIVSALTEQYLEETRKQFIEFENNSQYSDIEYTLDQMLYLIYGDWIENENEIRFSTSISKYCAIYPEIEAIDREHGKEIAHSLMRIMRKLGSSASDDELFMAGRHLYSMHNMLEQMIMEGGDPKLLIATHSELTRRMIRMMVSS